MVIARKMDAPRYSRDSIESYLLLSRRNMESGNLAITLVEMKKNGIQKPHRHVAEQAYYILEGTGLMQIGSEKKQVAGGDCVFIPANEEHSLINIDKAPLTYLSASHPGFTEKECEELWPLPSIEKTP